MADGRSTASSLDAATAAPVALITGSGRKRLGYTVADALARRGYRLALHYNRSQQAAERTRDELRQLAPACEIFSADLTQEQEVQGLVDQTMHAFGRIDVLVTTASIWAPKSFDQTTADDLLKNFQVNTMATFLCAQKVGQVMVEQATGGSQILFGDWAISRPYLDHAAYFISKGTIPTMTKVLAIELAEKNPKVRVNTIHPGPVMFPPHADDAEKQELIDSTLVKQADCPESIAQAVEFFIDNRFVTGTCLPVDGGLTIYAAGSVKRARSDAQA